MSGAKIGIFGNFGGGNLGNEGTLEAMIAFLQQVRPDAELICLCHRPETVSKCHRIKALAYRAPRRAPSLSAKIKARFEDLRLILCGTRGLGVLIVPGTGVLDDFGEKPQGMPLTIFLVCLFARLRGAKIYFVSIGAGPIENWLSRWLMKSAAALGHYRSYRDLPSKQFMKKLGLDVESDAVYPDLAFKLDVRHDDTHEAPQPHPVTIGVGVMTYRGWRCDPIHGGRIYAAYIEKILAFVLWLLDSGYNVRLLMGEDSDERAIADLSHKIRLIRRDLADGRFVAGQAGSLRELMAQIVRTDVVIATRFHNAVCALKVGRPTASIGYSAKFDALLTEMGLGEFCQHAESFDVELLKAHVTELIRNRDMYKHRIHQANMAFAERLRYQDRILASSFLGAQLASAL